MQEIQEVWVQSLGWEDLREKEMVTHSRILGWRIPWTEEPGRLQPIALQRVELDLANMCTHTYILCTHTYILYTHTCTSAFMMWKEISWKSYYIRTENSPVSRRTHASTVVWNNVFISWTFFWWNNFWKRHQVLESMVLAVSGPCASQTKSDLLDKKDECFHCYSII